MFKKDIYFIDPLSSGGVPPESVYEKLKDYFYGYSLCYHCTGNVHEIKKPNIFKLVTEDLPEFLGCDYVRLHHGARESAFTVLYALYKDQVINKKEKSPFVIVDGNSHYSMKLAAELSDLNIIETKTTEHPRYKIIEDDFETKVEDIIKKYGKPPLAFIINYPDGNYTNFCNLKKIVEIAKQYNIYTIIDGAYSVGRFPLSLHKIGADVILGSAHKSMACIGPLGVIGFNNNVANILLKKSQYKPKKELYFLGCTARGLPTLCLLEVIPYLKKRIKEWDKKVEIANYFVKLAEDKLNFKLLGEYPHKHDVLAFETPIFYEISKKLKDRFFLYKELKKRNIIGIKPGITKYFKLSTYLLSKEDVNYIIDNLEDIILKYI